MVVVLNVSLVPIVQPISHAFEINVLIPVLVYVDRTQSVL